MTQVTRPLIITLVAAMLAVSGCSSSQDEQSAKLQFAANEPKLWKRLLQDGPGSGGGA